MTMPDVRAAVFLFWFYGVRLCCAGEAFSDILRPIEVDKDPAKFVSQFYALWSTQLEVVPITQDVDGWEPASFHERLAQAALQGWQHFQENVVPGLQDDHPLRKMSSNARGSRKAFLEWQKRLFFDKGDVVEALRTDTVPVQVAPPADVASTWPELQGLYEYSRLRKIIDRLTRRYLIRSGVAAEEANGMNFSISNWQMVLDPTALLEPQTHVGQHVVGIFYAQAGSPLRTLRFADPRGESPPFGQVHVHTPQSGELLLFPPWLSHMTRIPAKNMSCSSEDCEKISPQVIYSFTVGPAGLTPQDRLKNDPTADMLFSRTTYISRAEMKLEA